MPQPSRPRPLTLTRRLAAAVLSGFAVAALTHLATVFVFFVTNGAAAENLVAINDFFVVSTLVLFVLAVIAAFAGANRHWAIALAAGLVAGALAAAVGTTVAVIASGAELSAEVAGFVLASLGGTSLVFVVLAGIATATAGRGTWVAVTSIRTARIAFVRPPASRLAEGQVTHIERVPVDAALADQQWESYVLALESAGYRTVEVAAADELPDSVFVEDALVVFGGTAVVTSPGAESRRAETDAVGAVARKAGLTLRTIELPGTLDGGDVLTVGTTVYVGRGGRTNAEGITQLRQILTPLGYRVVAVPVKKVLHLKSAVTALPDGTVVGFAKHVDAPGIFENFLAMPEPGAAVVVLSADTVLMAASVPKSIALVEDLGYTVVTVDISEFEKLEGCVTCLSVRVA